MKTQRQGSYTVREVASLLKVSEQTVRRLRSRGKLTPINLGLRSVRFAQSAVDSLIQEQAK